MKEISTSWISENSLKLTKGVVIVGHDIGESVRYISTSDDYLGFPGLVCQLCGVTYKSYD